MKLVYNWSVDKKLDDDFGFKTEPATIAEDDLLRHNGRLTP